MKISVSNRLRSYRIRAGLSQDELAKRCLISRNTISSLECGVFSASVSLALTLALVLGCTVEDLFCIDDDRLTVQSYPVVRLFASDHDQEDIDTDMQDLPFC